MRANLAAEVVRACRTVLPTERPLALHEPSFEGNEWRYLKECLDTRWVSSAGPFVPRFENELAAITGAAHAVAMNTGTAALHIALEVTGVRAGDEVLCPALTFVATANAVAYCGATPHFVEVDTQTLGLDAQALSSYLERIAVLAPNGAPVNRANGRPIRAMVVMHTFGHTAEMDALVALAQRWRLELIEDAAESIGSRYRGRHSGTLGHIGALSFNGNKTVTTGGGGALLTDDVDLAQLARHLSSTARQATGWRHDHDRVGYNYRMSNLSAALGLAQLEQLPGILERKRQLAEKYHTALGEIAGLRMFVPPASCESNHWLNTLILGDDDESLRDSILGALNDDGIAARPPWTPMHLLPMFRDCPRMPLAITERLARTIINLPSGPALIACDDRPA